MLQYNYENVNLKKNKNVHYMGSFFVGIHYTCYLTNIK